MDEISPSTNSMSLGDYYTAIKAEHEANNAWSAEQAQKAMDYQTQMSNTAHQREVADLRAAGLNPVLSAGGSGASTGSGVQAQRGDENVTALFGLTKMALDASIESSKAMNNVAHYVSGASGYASNSTVPGSSFMDVLADANYRLFGVKQEHFKAWLKSLGIDNLEDFLNLIGTRTTISYKDVPIEGSKPLPEVISKAKLSNIASDLHGRVVNGSRVNPSNSRLFSATPFVNSARSAGRYVSDTFRSIFQKSKK